MNLSPAFIAMFVAFMAIGITFTIRASINAKKRRQALQAFAQENGLDFADENSTQENGLALADENSTQTIDVQTALFDRGRSGRIRNIMKGKWGGFEASVFDYRYTIGGGKSSRTITQTAAVFVQQLSLPLFELHHVSFANRVGDVFFPRDIDFESNPEFSRRYMLSCKDKDAGRILFGPALLSYLEALPADDKLHIEANDHTLVIYRADVQVSAEKCALFSMRCRASRAHFFPLAGKRYTRTRELISAEELTH